jgi:hypothetical protein
MMFGLLQHFDASGYLLGVIMEIGHCHPKIHRRWHFDRVGVIALAIFRPTRFKRLKRTGPVQVGDPEVNGHVVRADTLGSLVG